jgi:HSP20 family protein
MSDDWWEDWMRGRRRRVPSPYRGFFEDPEEFMRELDRQFEEEFRWISEHAPKELTREKPSKGGIVREFGPFVYGYSVTMGPDGKPVIREFGNIKPGLPVGRPAVELKREREPVVDVIEEERQIKVVAELPGVRKEDVELNTTENSLTIRVEGEKRKYFKEVELPVEIEPGTAKATYTNGILEVTLEKKKPETGKKGVQVKIE